MDGMCAEHIQCWSVMEAMISWRTFCLAEGSEGVLALFKSAHRIRVFAPNPRDFCDTCHGKISITNINQKLDNLILV